MKKDVTALLKYVRTLNPERDLELITATLKEVSDQIDEDNRVLQNRLLGKCVGNNRVH